MVWWLWRAKTKTKMVVFVERLAKTKTKMAVFVERLAKINKSANQKTGVGKKHFKEFSDANDEVDTESVS